MDGFTKKFQLQDQTRRFSILTTEDGWEVREEHDSQVVRQAHYQDWHRVERATRSMAMELDDLRTKGWSEVT